MGKGTRIYLTEIKVENWGRPGYLTREPPLLLFRSGQVLGQTRFIGISDEKVTE